MNTYTRKLGSTAFAAVLLLLATAPGTASAQDVRGVPFEGCWTPAGGSGPELCITRTDEGLELVRRSDAGETGREILALGTVRELEQEGCVGTERARFSSDGQRVLVRTAYTCEGGVERVETGILALPSSSGRYDRPDFEQLLDVRSVSMDGESVAWVQRYRLAATDEGRGPGALRVEVARRAAASEIDVSDVVDASELVAPEAIEAWIAESGSAFDLDGATLVALADAGVAPDVLDVMIAVSHPESFALAVVDGGVAEAELMDRGGVARSGYAGGGWGMSPWGWGGAGAFGWNPYFGWDPYFSPFGFNRFGWASTFGAWGRPGWGWGGGGWGGGVVVVPGGGGGGDGVANGGRVVNGRGYTRGRGATSTGRSVPTGGSRPVAAPSRGARSGGAATSGGRSTGRTAKPRRGGGGGVD